ncbi:MAG: LysR family transcriptional regulator [Gluconobacter sp.]|uniref:LysR family transcriptional regulator n=1 Tax=Gluconobacter sp. TaxID=1876758 RepID=UPI0039EC7EEA
MNNISRIDLNLAHVFLALWHERSVSRAAERLSLTQPAVSSALRRLREACGDELFVRTRYGMQPTAHAVAIAETLEMNVSSLRSSLGLRGQFDPASSSRFFIIGSDGGLDYALGGRLVARLSAEAPDITLTFRTVSAPVLDGALGRREIDMALTISSLTRPDCVSSPLGSFRFVCVWHADFCILPGQMTPEDLERCRHVLVETALRHSIFDHRLRSMGIRRTVRTIVPSFGHLPTFLCQPDTIAIVPDYIAEFFLMTNGLRISSLPEVFGAHEVRMLLPRKSEYDAGVGWLEGLIRKVV